MSNVKRYHNVTRLLDLVTSMGKVYSCNCSDTTRACRRCIGRIALEIKEGDYLAATEEKEWCEKRGWDSGGEEGAVVVKKPEEITRHPYSKKQCAAVTTNRLDKRLPPQICVPWLKRPTIQGQLWGVASIPPTILSLAISLLVTCDTPQPAGAVPAAGEGTVSTSVKSEKEYIVKLNNR